jgi:hypothetical protein
MIPCGSYLEFRERISDKLTNSLATAAFLRFGETVDSIGLFLGETSSQERPNARRRAAHSTFHQRLFHLTKPPTLCIHKVYPRGGAPTCATRSAPLTPNHGVSMARRCSQRMRTHACAQEKLEHLQQAGGNVVSLAFKSDKAQGALTCLGSFRAGFCGAPYLWPLGTLYLRKWVAGFLEGRAQRGRAP